MKTYPADLRQRVLADCDAGMSTAEVAKGHSVGVAGVNGLQRRRRETGSTLPIERRFAPRPTWTAHAEQIVEAIRERPDDTLDEHRARLGPPPGHVDVLGGRKALGLVSPRATAEKG